jgi:hypothetical protein
MDGTMIHIREEGWKELKVGCVFKVEARPRRDQEVGKVEEQAHAVDNSYVAHLGGPEIFGQKMWAEADRDIGSRPGQQRSWGMGLAGSGTWLRNTSTTAISSWIGIMAQSIWR